MREQSKMSKNGRRAVQEKYNWEQEAKKLLALYKELIDESLDLSSCGYFGKVWRLLLIWTLKDPRILGGLPLDLCR